MDLDEETDTYMGMDEDGNRCYDDEEEDWSRPVGVADGPTEGSVQVPSNNSRLDQCQPTSMSSSNHQRTIIHIDVDCFYAQVEMIHNPALRDVPLGIQQKYIVVTCNYPARARGVTKLMGIAEAKKKCPELVLVSGEDLTRYRDMSYKISEFLMKYTPHVERLGFDENYLDVTDMVEQRICGGTDLSDIIGHTYVPDDSDSEMNSQRATVCPCGCHHRLAVGSQIASDIRSAMAIELNVTCCAGIAHNKLLAKVVGSHRKPNQQTTLLTCHALALIASLKTARQIPGVGSATSKRLQSIGVVSVSDLQRCPPSQLEEEFGVAMATTIHQLSMGIDDSPVVTYSRPQTLSIEDSFRRCSSEDDARLRISQLVANFLPRVQEDGRCPHTFRLTVRKANKENRYLHRESRQCNMPPSIISKITSGQFDHAKDLLVPMAMTLFGKMVDCQKPFHLTLINIAFAKLEETARNTIANFFSAQTALGSKHAASLSQHIGAIPEEPSSQSAQSVQSSQKSNILSQSSSSAVSPTSVKRKHSFGLDSFLVKKKKEAGAGVARPAEESTRRDELQRAGNCSRGGVEAIEVGCHDAESVHGTPTSSVPTDVDPEVFSQLPPEIQQEILGTVPPRKSAELRATVTSSASYSATRSDLCQERQGEARTEKTVVVSKKKPLFSPTKSSERKTMMPPTVEAHSKREQCSRNIYSVDITHDCGSDSQRHKDTTAAARKPHQPSGSVEVPVCETIDSVDDKPHRSINESSVVEDVHGHQSSTPELVMNSVTTNIPQGQGVQSERSVLLSSSYSEKVNTDSGKSANSSPLISSLNHRKMAVPRGVAPDVFSALPPDIQREVAAEIAIQKHNIDTTENSDTGQRRTQAKSPAVKMNSMLKYLKKM